MPLIDLALVNNVWTLKLSMIQTVGLAVITLFIGFGLGATPNALVNMLSLASKHGPSPRAWLVVSLVGAFLIDFANAFLITTMAGILY